MKTKNTQPWYFDLTDFLILSHWFYIKLLGISNAMFIFLWIYIWVDCFINRV